MAYTKLHQEIVTSTIWREAHTTRILWVSMLALANKNGEVWASIPGLAHVSRISLEECEVGLAVLLSPDKYSRTPDLEGRRIEKIDGGWSLVNHAKYRLLCSKQDGRESAKMRQRAKRERDAARTDMDAPSKRLRQDRMTDELRNMVKGQSVVVPNAIARCASQYHRYHGRDVVQQNVSDTETQIWIIG